jgi:hypothetical protein
MNDMIRGMSPSSVNRMIDRETLDTIERYKGASPEEVTARLKELDGTWDLECYIELGGAIATLAGVALASRFSRKWLFLPAIAQGLVLAHSLPLWDPLTPLLRMLGLWSRQEIEREKQALKLSRGDYERVQKDGSAKSALASSQGQVGIKAATGTRRTGKKKTPVAPAMPDDDTLEPTLQ